MLRFHGSEDFGSISTQGGLSRRKRFAKLEVKITSSMLLGNALEVPSSVRSFFVRTF